MKKSSKPIDSLILTLRGQRVILAADLAGIYGVETKRLNEQVRRNHGRFPPDFLFQLDAAEFDRLKRDGTVNPDGSVALRSQIATIKRGAHVKYPPFAFTEHGAIMVATVLNSPQAVNMSVFVVRAFIKQRELLSANEAILRRLAEIDRELFLHDTALRDLYQKLLPLLQPPPDPPKRQIGFHP